MTMGYNSFETGIFKCSPSGALGFVAGFGDVTYGYGDILMGKDGNMYGLSSMDNTYGSIYKVTPSGTVTTFARFNQSCYEPWSGLTQDAAGNLYGVTMSGGASGNGAVYKVDTKGNLTVIGSFDGHDVPSQMILGKDGWLYGTCQTGGSANAGYVFKVKPPKSTPAATTRRPSEVDANEIGDSGSELDLVVPAHK